MPVWKFAAARLGLIGTIGLTGVALHVGRLAPTLPKPDSLRPAAIRYSVVDARVLKFTDARFRLLDVETGRVKAFSLPAAHHFEIGTCSPWVDGRGRTHLAGRWFRDTGNSAFKVGLGRFALPGGESLDLVETDVLMRTAPCWCPDGREAILYAGWDGRLYGFSFADRSRPGPQPAASVSPEPLTWRCPVPWDGRFAIDAPVWPADSRLGERLIVSVRSDHGVARPEDDNNSQLWWLRLGDGGMTIAEAGRLIVSTPGAAARPTVREDFPCVSTTPDGGLALAYLGRTANEEQFHLRLARMTVDAGTGAPRVEDAHVVELAADRCHHPLAFSPDGRWVYSFPNDGLPRVQAERSSVVDGLSGGGE